MLNYQEIVHRYRVEPRGVIHVGAFGGSEDGLYRQIGFRDRLFLEAQPETYATLVKNLDGSGADCLNVAASDRSGPATFHVASNGQSSSLLALKTHADVYPDIVVSNTITVTTARLDDILAEPRFADKQYNFLNMDIQGAELLALSGACATLRKLDLINLEVNYDELYTGAPHISELDAFLGVYGFVRADTVLAHATWGDAMYVRKALTKHQRGDASSSVFSPE